MEILRAIEMADALCPNPYSTDEKILWCDEVSAEIRRHINKKYNIIETTLTEGNPLILPPGISSDLVEKVIVGKKTYQKLDFRSFTPPSLPSGSSGSKVKVVYIDLPDPIRIVEIKGEFNTNENLIKITNSPFIQGDKLRITPLSQLTDEPDPENSVYAYVLDVTDMQIILDRDVLEAKTSSPLSVCRVIDDVTEIDDAPYDRMYIEYILSKIALYQHDYVSYNAHMTQYNSLFESARREYFTRNPLTTQANFKNYSII